ncbi:hypothetical protein [Micromonospora sp. 067-2]|uniref:hypothetical protein n=1 Tax=Micromonospora sp. 067-2 TaxID=2789270 RepID=UPI00397D18F5
MRRQFGPAAAAWGLDDPVEDDLVIPGIEYRGDRLTYDWMLDPREGDLSVGVRLVVAEGTLRTFVQDLVVGGGLGVAQDLHRNARTWRGIQKAIASHTAWLERLHPVLSGPDARQLMDRAGALLAALDR